MVTYKSGTVVSYACSHEQRTIHSVALEPVFHQHPGIDVSPQLQLFDLSRFPRRYVSRRPPYRKRRPKSKRERQLCFGFVFPSA